MNRLFLADFNAKDNVGIQRDSHRKYFVPRIEIKDYKILIDGRNFYDQNISDKITRYNELIKLTTGKSEDYTTGCLLDFQFYKDHYSIVAVDLSKQSALDSDPRCIQQIEFTYKLDSNTTAQILTVSEKEKQTVLEFSRGNVKVL